MRWSTFWKKMWTSLCLWSTWSTFFRIPGITVLVSKGERGDYVDMWTTWTTWPRSALILSCFAQSLQHTSPGDVGKGS